MAFGHSSLRWFEACSCKPAPRGPPSSFAQLRALYEKMRSWRTSSGPGEFHPQALTEPHVNLSIHRAPASHSLETSRPQAYAKRTRFLPVAWLTIACCELAHPLRSSPITELSTLLLDDPSPSCASILSPFVDLTYRVFS